jgi:serine protease Do
VPINQAVAILPQLKTRGSVSRGFIGVVLTDVTPDLQRSLKLPVSRGALVQDVTENSPAARAGLQAVRRHPHVDGREIWTNEELIREISGRQPGSAARLELLRGRPPQSTQVKLVERPGGSRRAGRIAVAEADAPAAARAPRSLARAHRPRDGRGVRPPHGDSRPRCRAWS